MYAKSVTSHFIVLLGIAAVAANRESDSLLSLQQGDEIAAGEFESVDALLKSDEFPAFLKQQPNPKEFWDSVCTPKLHLSNAECESYFHAFESCNSVPKQTSDFPNENVSEATNRVGTHNCKARSNGPLCSYPPTEMLAKGAYEDLSDTAWRTAVVNVDQSVMTHLVGNDRVWIVEFYADWCPHCRAFAPKFFAMGAALRRTGSPTMLGGVNCEVHADLCQEHNVQGYPTLKVFYHGSDERVTMALHDHNERWSGGQVNPELFLTLLNYKTDGQRGLSYQTLTEALTRLDANEGNCQEQRELVVGGGWPAAERHAAPSSRLADARFMLLYTLRHWVSPAAKPVKPRAFTHDDLAPLSLWLNVVARNFPDADMAPKFRQLAAFVEEAAKRLEYAVCVDDWTKQLDGLGIPTIDEITAAVPTETTCQTETCRLWALIHILSLASQAHWPGAASDAETARGIHAFLENHFRCDVCRNHYLLQVETASYGLQEMDRGNISLAIYLWRFHNAVSTRIAAEKNCFHPVLDRRWPSSESCSQCWDSSSRQWSVIVEASELLHDSLRAALHDSSDAALPMQLPDEKAVMQQLLGVYWPDAAAMKNPAMRACGAIISVILSFFAAFIAGMSLDD